MAIKKKNLFMRIIENEVTMHEANLINANPSIMKKLCQIDPNYIKYARGKARSVELLELVMSHPDYTEDILTDALSFHTGISESIEIMKKLCSIDASYFQYCKGPTLTYEMYELAKASEKNSHYVDSFLNSMGFHSVIKKEEILKFLKIDGRLIDSFYTHYITKEMIELALNHPDKIKRATNYDLGNLFYSKKHMRYLCEIDGLYFLEADNDVIDETLIKIAINHPDPEKRLTLDRIPQDKVLAFDYNKIKDLIQQDERWLKYVDLQTMDDKILINLIKNKKVIPTAKIIEEFKNNPEILDTILKAAKNGQYSIIEMRSMLEFTVDRKFINSKFFTELSEIICKESNIEPDFFKYIINRSIAFNSEILTTINYSLLNSRFHKIYEGNGYEKLYSICVYPDIQDMIVKIGNPKKTDGSINYDLGDKRLELLSRMLSSVLIDKNGNKIQEWIPYYNGIIRSLYNKKEILDYFANHIDELDDKRLITLTNYLLGNHSFKIKTIEDLDNYEEIRNNWIDETTNSYSMRDVKSAAFEKVFGISMKTAEGFRPYCEGILLKPESFHPNIVEFIKAVDQILKENNMSLLRETIKAFERSAGLDEKGIIHLRTMLKKQYLHEYNRVLFDTKDKLPDHILNGVKLYHAGGKNGDKDFSLCIHAVGAYMGSSDTTARRFNFKEDWNRPIITNHGICSSFISSSHLGTALTRSVIYGFTDYEEGALLLSGPTDIYSSNESFDTMSDEDSKSTYLLPQDMVDYTRHTHNEMVFERRVGNQKRQPSYIVLMCDDYNKALLNYRALAALGRYSIFKKTLSNSIETKDADAIYYALKAAKDFGVPIVVVERSKVAKNQYNRIMSRLEEFKQDTEMNRDEIREYYHDIIVNLANNHAGNREYHKKIDERYFGRKIAEKVIEEIKEKIELTKQSNPALALIMLEELEKSIVHEEYKSSDTWVGSLFETNEIREYCEQGKKDLRFANQKGLNIICVFNNSMNNVDNLMEYNRVVTGRITKEEQYYLDDVKNVIDDSLLDKILLTTTEITKQHLYDEKKSTVHSNRHIENVILFSAVIGKKINLEERDMDLVLKAALYHDCGRTSDGRTPHAKASSLIAYEKLKEALPKQDLKILMAAIEYHEVEEKLLPPDNKIDSSKLIDICHNIGLDTTDEKLMERTRKIAFVLKDADALDRTRFLAETPSFVNPQRLHYNISKKLIKFSCQINEYYASKDIETIIGINPETFDVIQASLETTKNPKKTLRLYKTGKLKQETFEEGNGYGTKK